MQLTEEQIAQNFKDLLSLIKTHIDNERGDNLVDMYNSYSEKVMFAPASGIEHYHNCFVGGYVDHVIRVTKCADQLYALWRGMGADMSGYTREELMFAAINHDLGKIGDTTQDYYVPCPSEWHRKNQGKLYDINPHIQNMSVPHRSLFLLQNHGIKVSQNEMIGILIHDGMYDEANTKYLKAWDKNRKIHNNLPLILHHADHMASQIEYENWKTGVKPAPVKATNFKKKPAASKLSTGKSDAQDLFKGLFGETN